MRKLATLLFSIILTMFIMPVAYGKSNDEPAEFIVKYAEDMRKVMNENLSKKVEFQEKITEQVELLIFPATENAEEIQKQLESDPSIAIVERNYMRQLKTTTNDPYYSSQWWIPHVNAQSFWTSVEKQQKKTVVAVIDSGIDLTHEDLRGKIEPGGYNFYSDNTNIADVNGHGTNVAGVIAANSNNRIGITGVTGPFDITILPIRISDKDGYSYISDLVKSIDYAIAKKVDVINLSLGGSQHSAIENEAVQRAIRAGITVVAAAGNEAQKGNQINYPASYQNVLSIGAVDRYNNRAMFSNYNSFVDLTAPGQSIYTTTLYSQYEQVNGTSFSTPIVAGAVAMMKALEPELTLVEIKNALQQTATDLGAPGIDPHFGAGVLNMKKLSEQFAPAIIPVQGVRLSRDTIHFDLNDKREKMVMVEPTELKKMDEQRSSAAITFETEPNNSMLTSNLFPLGNSIVGSITNHHFDLDYFKFTADTDGRFSLLGSWIDSTYVSARENNYLAIGLYNSNQQLIRYASLTDRDNYQYLSQELTKGTYYLVVFQASDYQYLFTDEQYMITTMFKPHQLPEQEVDPTILFDYAFLEEGQSESFVLDLEEDSQVRSSNPSVATIDQNGKVHAIGHGMTTIYYISEQHEYEAVVKVTRKTSLPTSALFEMIYPRDATNQEVAWSSSNPSVAKVDEYGIVTAYGVGRAKITVMTEEGSFTSQAEVIVEGPEEIPEFVGNFPDMEVDDEKTFTITFNHSLIKGKDYTNDLFITQNLDGKIPIGNFKATVHPDRPNQLLVTPNSTWNDGEHFMIISKNLQNDKKVSLKQDVKMKFNVISSK